MHLKTTHTDGITYMVRVSHPVSGNGEWTTYEIEQVAHPVSPPWAIGGPNKTTKQVFGLGQTAIIHKYKANDHGFRVYELNQYVTDSDPDDPQQSEWRYDLLEHIKVVT